MPHGESSDIGSLSDPAIRRRMRSDAVQHPATLLPLTGSIMSAIYLLLLSPVFGGGRWAVVLLGVSGTVAVAAFVWRYVYRYTEDYASRVRGLMDSRDREQARLEEAEAARLCTTLQSGFSSIDANDGLKALKELVREYDQLRPTLGRQSDSDPPLHRV